MSSQSDFQSMRDRFHPRCIACSPNRPDGLRLSFAQTANGGVEAPLSCTQELEGYPGVVHGGVLALVFDSAMANCMFSRGYRAVTAELTVRYLGPVSVGESAVVSVNVVREAHPLYVLEGRVTQGGQEKARATGKFVAQAEEPG
ncbi:MAG TPA: PaaI family thioesterase [Myxococcales bacterium]